MNFKLPIISGILILAFVAFVAAISLSLSASSISFSTSSTSNSFTATTSSPSNFSLSATDVIANSKVKFTVTPSSSTTGTTSAVYSVIASPITGSLSDLPTGKYSASIDVHAVNSANAADSANSTITFEFNKGFCKFGQLGNDTVGKLEVKSINLDSSGDKDDVWNPLDELSIEVKVKNPTNKDVHDVIVELGLFDSSGNNLADDLDFSSKGDEQYDLGTVNDDSTETATFVFTVPVDFDDGSYTLVAKAYEDGSEDSICGEDLTGESIDVEREDDDGLRIIVDDINLPLEATCGESISGTFNLVNVGDNDEDQVKVQLTGSDLGLSQDIIVKNLDEQDSKKLSFNFNVPQSVSDGVYLVKFRTFYDYDDNHDEYDQESDETFATSVKVLGCASSGNGGLSIDASLQDDNVKAGGKAVVLATLTNLGNSQESYTISASDYDSWASLSGISPQAIVLAPGASKTVKITLDVDSTASGSESFSLEALSASGSLESQEIELNIQGAQSLSLGGNSTLWIVGIINVILIILIIIIAVRLGRR